MADGTRRGGRARLRGPHGARARHELPGCEPAAGPCLPRGLGGGRPVAGSFGATPAARVSGRPGVHPDQARPHAGEHRRHPRRARSALQQDGMRRRLAARVRGAPRPGRGSLPDGRDRLPRSAGHRRRHHGPGRLPHRRCCSTLECPNCATIRASCACARASASEFWLATGKWPDCVDDVPYDFKAECEKARHIPIQECAALDGA